MTPVSRRAVLRSAAWTVPAIALATAAPAAVASQSLPGCQEVQHLVSMGDFTTSDSGTDTSGFSYSTGNVWSVPPLGVDSTDTVGINVRTVFDENSTPTGDHYKLLDLNQTAGTAGLQVKNEKALKFSMTVSGPAGSNGSKPVGQTITVSFTRPVRNLSFVITDVDGNNSNQWDRVFITHLDGVAIDQSVAPFTATMLGGNVSGSGTETSPWQSPYNASVPDANADGNLRVSVPRELTTFTFRFRNVAGAANTNSLNLTQLTFQSETRVNCTPAA